MLFIPSCLMKEQHRVQPQQSLPEAAALHSFPRHNNKSHSFLLQMPIKLEDVQYFRHVLNICIAPFLTAFRQCELTIV